MTGVRLAANPRYRSEIEKNYELARLIGASGTPAFVVGGKVLRGAVGYDALKSAIAEARRT
jgi:protein-disulfide isomerase